MGYVYIFACIIFTVAGQLLLKWRINLKPSLEGTSLWEKMIFLVKLYLDPWILLGFFSGFLASIAWMAAMTKFEVSFAYPFMSLAFILVFILGIFLFNEIFTWGKLIGLALIIIGLIISVKY